MGDRRIIQSALVHQAYPMADYHSYMEESIFIFMSKIRIN